jgi:hypothetical protein
MYNFQIALKTFFFDGIHDERDTRQYQSISSGPSAYAWYPSSTSRPVDAALSLVESYVPPQVLPEGLFAPLERSALCSPRLPSARCRFPSFGPALASVMCTVDALIVQQLPLLRPISSRPPRQRIYLLCMWLLLPTVYVASSTVFPINLCSTYTPWLVHNISSSLHIQYEP